VSTSAATPLEWLLRPAASDVGIDRKALAGLLVELARNVEPGACAEPNGVASVDPRLQQLRTLLVGHEIEVLTRLRAVVEDPEQLAQAVGRVLPTAIASSDARLGQVLAPALEKATQSSIRSDPRTLVNILHPLIVPAIRKSIGEAIDKTFESLNESLKHSLTWRGLKWRFEAWRTGTSFAEVVLKHTLVYQVEHVFLIHQRSGLLIAHVAAEDAVSQDPLLVSSMLTAIQDFVRDSFMGADHQGVDTLRLGDFRLWCEPGPYAMLVAVIRGNPPEELHETLRNVLERIHTERRQALETFGGDSSGFTDVEAHLRECAAMRQTASRSARPGFPWLVALIALAMLVLLGAGGVRWWKQEQMREAQQRVWEARQRVWENYIERLRTEPGIVVTDNEERDGKFVVAGLRDPLAADPQRLLRDAGVDPARVASRWQPYLALEPQFVLVRLRQSLDPPPAVTLGVSGDRIVATGTASSAWLARARAIARTLPAGAPALDLSGVRDLGEGPLIKLREEIETTEIHFDVNASLPAPGQDPVLDKLAAELKRLASLSSSMRVATRVTLTGHSDDTGPGTLNLSLSLARAGAVLTLLKKRGVDTALISLHGAGPLDPLEAGASDAARSANRRVSMSVWLEGQP
jgi:outer membrane protein OmpA-like peptidoglycan-associated protein